jgi:hypothetical protein
MEDTKLIHEFQKNANEKVRVELCQFQGKDYINLRIYFQDDDNQWRPTKKGITIASELIEELKKGTDKALAEWQAKICSSN